MLPADIAVCDQIIMIEYNNLFVRTTVIDDICLCHSYAKVLCSFAYSVIILRLL